MATIVVLDPVANTPPYTIYGQATCVGPCNGWVWLGSETYDLVRRGEAEPLCLPCAELAFTMMRAEGGMPVWVGHRTDR